MSSGSLEKSQEGVFDQGWSWTLQESGSREPDLRTTDLKQIRFILLVVIHITSVQNWKSEELHYKINAQSHLEIMHHLH